MMTTRLLFLTLACWFCFQSGALAHEMQHGFILSNADSLASHLVASGHHSRQVELAGDLLIPDPEELQIYLKRKSQSSDPQSYFLLQAQHLDILQINPGQILSGHIVESTIGKYEPERIIVKSAQFQVRKVLLNIENPFFGSSPQIRGLNELREKHCCDTGRKPCHWKC